MKTHGMSNHKFYNTWISVKKRCDRQNCTEYKDYGGRGITHSDSWSLFINFKKDMYMSYLKHAKEFGEKETTIDREDVNGNYCKENCRWQTRKEQCNNKRNNLILEYNNEKLPIIEMAKKYNMKLSTLYSRLWRGWNVEKAITKPLKNRSKTNIIGGKNVYTITD